MERARPERRFLRAEDVSEITGFWGWAGGATTWLLVWMTGGGVGAVKGWCCGLVLRMLRGGNSSVVAGGAGATGDFL